MTSPWFASQPAAETDKGIWARHFSIPSAEESDSLNPCALLVSLIAQIPDSHLIADSISCLESMIKHKNSELRVSFLQAFLQARSDDFGGFVKAVFLGTKLAGKWLFLRKMTNNIQNIIRVKERS